MKRFIALLKKDLINEIRGRETLITLLGISIFLTTLCSTGIQIVSIPVMTVVRIYPWVLWVVFFVSATLALEKLYSSEVEDNAFEATLLTKCPSPIIFCSKLLSGSVITFICFGFTLLVSSLFLNISVFPFLVPLLLIGLLVVVAYTALCTILSAITATSKLTTLLLPLVAFPLLFPLFFAAIEATAGLVIDQRVAADPFWLLFLLMLDVVYVLVGTGLFSFTQKG